MSAYFQDLISNVVLKFDYVVDIKGLREQIADYKEVDESVYNTYKGIGVEQKQPKQPK